jgi:ABC-type phosphate/phosphonate transport system substrate-binding protein
MVASAIPDEAAPRPLASHDGNDQDLVRIGAVAYAPSVVTVFHDLCRYLNGHGFPSDYVLYSNYDALVAALDRGEVDIAWNTPLAHARFHVENGCASRTLVMRDVDYPVRSILVARKDSGIHSVKDLTGKKLVLGSADAAEATVLPMHYLEQENVAIDEVMLVSLDKEVDFKGNPCSSPSHVLQAVRDGRGDAGIITESLWKHVSAGESNDPSLQKIWTSPPFSHCVFTASKEFDESLARRFTELMTAMDVSDPGCADIMRLEGTQKWVPGGQEGFTDLVEALRKR